MREAACKSQRREFRSEAGEKRSENGGAGRNRTADKGFADLCLTTWRPRRLLVARANHNIGSARKCMEDSYADDLLVSSSTGNENGRKRTGAWKPMRNAAQRKGCTRCMCAPRAARSCRT